MELLRLNDAEAFTRIILDSVADEIAVINSKGVITLVNEPWRKFAIESGRESGQPIVNIGVGSNYLQACCTSCGEADIPNHPDPRVGIQAVLDGRLPSFSLEYACHTPDQKRWFKMKVMPLDGGRKGAVISHTNITEFKQAEQALRLSEERWKFALEGAAEGVWDVNLQTGEAHHSKRYVEMLGYTDGELKESRSEWLERIHPDDKAQVQADIQAYFDGKTPIYTTENRMRCKDGSYKWIYARGMVVSRTADGKPLRMIGTQTDITERKQIEAQLRESEERFRNIANSAPLLIWTSGTDQLCNWFSQGWLDFTGHTMAQEMDNGWTKGLHPEDFQRCVDCYVEHFNQRQPFKMEYRLKHHSGEYRWIHDSGMPRFDPGGEFLGYIGACVDISEQKQADESLRLSASVFAHAQESIMITDAHSNVVEINTAFTRDTGYGRDEILGKNPRILQSGLHNREFYQAVWQAIEASGYWNGELWNRKKNGEVYAVLLNISAVKNTAGKITHFVGISSDITYLKQHQQELQRIAQHDALTGLPNRMLLADRMQQALAQARREKHLLGVCYLDLDGFKIINDSLGHEAGDQVLIEVAKRIGDNIRGGDTVARLGGDEFVVLLYGLDEMEDYTSMLDRLLLAIARPISLNQKEICVGASIGVSIFPSNSEDPDTLLRQADQAMYVAKQSGRNRYQLYSRS